jgi:hypothetical protein
MRFARLSYILALQLMLAPLGAQGPSGAVAPSGTKLKILTIDGEGVINNIQQRIARDVTVQVNDENDKPVVGATVAFTLPSEGVSGTFANGATTVTATSNDYGRVVIRGFRPNNIAGKLQIHVNASYRGQTARVTVTQFNMAIQHATHKAGHGKIIAVLAAIGAVAAGGAYAGMHKSESSPSTLAPPAVASVGISPGTGTVGPPH